MNGLLPAEYGKRYRAVKKNQQEKGQAPDPVDKIQAFSHSEVFLL